jgi:hypothetical protein
MPSMGTRYNSRASWCFDDGWYHICVETPSYQPGHNEVGQWCHDNLGYYRNTVNPDTFGLRVYFRELEHATMYKLVFGGDCIEESTDDTK